MKRCLIFFMLLVLVLALPVSAKFEQQKCGPYLVTFNLTTTEEMNITSLDPAYLTDHVLYALRLANRSEDECGLIGVCTFYRPASSRINIDNLASFIETIYRNTAYSTINKSKRMIDGHQGFLVSGLDLLSALHWQAGYWIIDAGTIVELQGDRNWQKKDVTAMLDSIHIERVGF